jgi:predicted nucleic acid-binding protein
MQYLLDTNIILEILLDQKRAEEAKHFIVENIGNLFLSDFSLHSIGLHLFRKGLQHTFTNFARDFLSTISICGLPAKSYSEIDISSKEFGLDFDDTYQYLTATNNSLCLATFDNDFKSLPDSQTVIIL